MYDILLTLWPLYMYTGTYVSMQAAIHATVCHVMAYDSIARNKRILYESNFNVLYGYHNLNFTVTFSKDKEGKVSLRYV